jgi:hypothetical protein
LRAARTLKTDDEKQYWYGKYESQSFLHFLLLRYDYRTEKLLKIAGYYWSNKIFRRRSLVAHAAEGD